MEAVPDFLDEAARRLVPGCDPAVVRAVFARASVGYAGPRGRDGRRVSAITPSGVPFEASLTAGGGRSPAALRYVTETATGVPFFGPRLAAQRAAFDDLVRWLPEPARSPAEALRDAFGVLFPDPSVVPARTRFATTFGIVHRDDHPGGLSGLKLYGNLRADAGSLARAAARWPTVADLWDRVADLAFLAPHFATVEVDRAGRPAHKLYLRTRRANAAAVALLARRFGAEAGGVLAACEAAGAPAEAWRRPFFVCAEARSGESAAVSVHLSARALGLDGGAMARLARRLVAGADGGGDGVRGLDALAAATDAAGGAWTTTVVAAGLTPGGEVGKVNVYLAPLASTADAAAAAGGQTEAPRFSNSGWTGSRVGS